MENMSSKITSRLEEIGSEDREMMQCLIGIFQEQSPALMQEISNTANNQDPQETRNAAHTLKGVCLNLGLTPMSCICEQIEKQALAKNFSAVQELCKELETTYQQVNSRLEQLSNSVH